MGHGLAALFGEHGYLVGPDKDLVQFGVTFGYVFAFGGETAGGVGLDVGHAHGGGVALDALGDGGYLEYERVRDDFAGVESGVRVKALEVACIHGHGGSFPSGPLRPNMGGGRCASPVA